LLGGAIGRCAGSATSIVYFWTPGDSARTGFSFQVGGEGDRNAVCRVRQIRKTCWNRNNQCPGHHTSWFNGD